MSRLAIRADHDPATILSEHGEHGVIAALLAEHGVRFERWTTLVAIPPGAAPEVVLEAYRDDISRLIATEGYRTVDVVSLAADHPQRAELRKKFLHEHIHREDEVRFFVAGRGLFSLHLRGRVYEVLCEQGDLISVPAGTPHWFDMGEAPSFVAIRLFNDPSGWIAEATGSELAAACGRLE